MNIHTLHAAGLPWTYSSMGPSDAPALILLHGFLGGKEVWNSVADVFRSDWHCILPDLPGSGLSSTQLPLQRLSELSIEDLADSLCEFIDVVSSGSPPTLFGYSMGGRVALATAIRHPGKLKRLILEAANPGLETPQEREERLEIDKKIALRIQADLGSFLNFWYREVPLFRDTITRDEPKLKALIQRRWQSNNAQYAAQTILSMSPGRMQNYWPRLKELDLSVSLISGELDTKYGNICSRMTTQIPRSTHFQIPDAGHNAHFERPVEFVKVLKAILTGSNLT